MKETSILGVSMTRRSRRRMLVFAVYLLLAILVVFLNWTNRFLRPGAFLTGFNLLYVFLFTGVSRMLFGRLIGQTTFPTPGHEGPGGVRVSFFGRVPMPVDAPDERDTAVRNWAYFQAFRVIAFYSVLLWVVYSTLNSAMLQIPLNISALLIFPLLAMVTTLPQAVLLWSEPDVPTPDEELSSATAR